MQLYVIIHIVKMGDSAYILMNATVMGLDSVVLLVLSVWKVSFLSCTC